MKLDENISAVITGGASGLGEATARELSKFGVKCALFDLNAEKGETVASEIGGVFCEANVTSDESVVAAFEKSRSEIGQERILINCAGIGIAVKTAARDRKTGDIVPHPLDPFNTVIQINLIGSFTLGIIFALSSNQLLDEKVTLLVATGILGSFTTMSTYSIETITLWQNDKIISIFYILTTAIICPLLALFGMELVNSELLFNNN